MKYFVILFYLLSLNKSFVLNMSFVFDSRCCRPYVWSWPLLWPMCVESVAAVSHVCGLWSSWCCRPCVWSRLLLSPMCVWSRLLLSPICVWSRPLPPLCVESAAAVSLVCRVGCCCLPCRCGPCGVGLCCRPCVWSRPLLSPLSVASAAAVAHVCGVGRCCRPCVWSWPLLSPLSVALAAAVAHVCGLWSSWCYRPCVWSRLLLYPMCVWSRLLLSPICVWIRPLVSPMCVESAAAVTHVCDVGRCCGPCLWRRPLLSPVVSSSLFIFFLQGPCVPVCRVPSILFFLFRSNKHLLILFFIPLRNVMRIAASVYGHILKFIYYRFGEK